MCPFSLHELKDAVHGLDGASCPEDDELTHMPQPMSSGIISLIPKGGGTSSLQQWSPITLMPLIYKILAWMITARLKRFLSDLIHSSQARFVRDHSILDNVVTFYETTDWARQSVQPTVIMLLDFEKAYDRVNRAFLEGTLSRMGFAQPWLQGISALYRSAIVVITIAGHVGRLFTGFWLANWHIQN
ncbi:hypothetical protein L7F22_031137 [Adiantum nelumboides]|nr:hypothetical protein [Adiantum nelumboides]